MLLFKFGLISNSQFCQEIDGFAPKGPQELKTFFQGRYEVSFDSKTLYKKSSALGRLISFTNAFFKLFYANKGDFSNDVRFKTYLFTVLLSKERETLKSIAEIGQYVFDKKTVRKLCDRIPKWFEQQFPKQENLVRQHFPEFYKFIDLIKVDIDKTPGPIIHALLLTNLSDFFNELQKKNMIMSGFSLPNHDPFLRIVCHNILQRAWFQTLVHQKCPFSQKKCSFFASTIITKDSLAVFKKAKQDLISKPQGFIKKYENNINSWDIKWSVRKKISMKIKEHPLSIVFKSKWL